MRLLRCKNNNWIQTVNSIITCDRLRGVKIEYECIEDFIQSFIYFDFQTGKVDQKDYTELRQQLEREAVQILRQLDAADPFVTLDHEIEHQVFALRRRVASTGCGSSRESCFGCGTPLENGDNFCPCCGQALRRS